MAKTSQMFYRPTPARRELLALRSLAEIEQISQHELGRQIGVSSAMANNYVKALVDHGYVMTSGETNRSKRYLVTATGRTRLTLLMREYAKEITGMYSIAKTEVEKRLRQLWEEGVQTVVVFGAAETGELIYSAVKSTPIRIVGWVDNDVARHEQRFGDLTVCPPHTIESCRPDAVLIASSGKTEGIHRQLHYLSKKGIAIVTL
ncbi:MAG: MarR family transcriptional regulator [Nitrospira sp.]|nr:MAG: MarR family transcriptional regulator [Nitrospira sp.]